MNEVNKKRLDALLFEKGLVETKSKAVYLIKAGLVKVNGKIIQKPGKLINLNSKIEIVNENVFYVSRAGEKLAFALKKFGIDVNNKICLDVGSSTGGFVDCLLRSGAKLVYAVDVGENQLDLSLKNNKKVKSFEKTDIRKFSLPSKRKVDLVTIDVSFISVNLILPAIKKFLSPKTDIIVLIKPQFEVGKKNLNKKGVVKNFISIKEAIKKIIQNAMSLNLYPKGLILSPIKGKKGNQEFLLYLKEGCLKDVDKERIINQII